MKLTDAVTEYVLDHSNWTDRSRDWHRRMLAMSAAYCREQGLADVEAVTRPFSRRYVESKRQRTVPHTGKPFLNYTAQNYVRALRAFLRRCVDEELVDGRVPCRLPMPKGEKVVRTTLTAEHFERLIEVAGTSGETRDQVVRDEAMLVLLDRGLPPAAAVAEHHACCGCLKSPQQPSCNGAYRHARHAPL